MVSFYSLNKKRFALKATNNVFILVWRVFWLLFLNVKIHFRLDRLNVFFKSYSKCANFILNFNQKPAKNTIHFIENEFYFIFVLIYVFLFFYFSILCRESVFPFTLGKPVSKSETPVGNCIVWSMESNRTVKCHQTKPSEVAMILSTLSSVRLVLENTFQELFLLILNPLLLVCFIFVLFLNITCYLLIQRHRHLRLIELREFATWFFLWYFEKLFIIEVKTDFFTLPFYRFQWFFILKSFFLVWFC